MTKRFYAKYIANERAVHLITFLGFVFGFSGALLVYIASSYFKEVLETDNVGIFYVISSIVLLILFFYLNKLIEGFGRARTLMTLLAIQIALLFLLQFTEIAMGGAILLMMYITIFGIVSVVFDIVLEAYSIDGETGRTRGLFLSVYNFGFLMGPLASVYILQQYGFDGIFLTTMILYIIMFLTIFMTLNDIKGHVKKQNLSSSQIIIKFKSNINLVKIYWVSFTLRFFYATMTVFMPLYLREIGLSWSEIGLVFTVMLVPFIFLEYPAGVLADKKYGEKEMLFIGSVIVIVSTTIMFFINSSELWIWMSILFISRIGAALLEAMRDSYFYKQIDENDVALINFFRSTRATGFIASAILVGIALAFSDNIQYIFIVLIVVLAVGLYPIITLKDTK